MCRARTAKTACAAMRAHDPVARIKDHIRDGIDAEIIFPNKGLMMFATKDAGVRHGAVQGLE